MDLRHTPEQTMLRDSTRRFLQDRCPFDPQARALPASPSQRALWQACAGLGLAGLVVPEDAGGLAGSPIEVGIVMEEIGRQLAVTPFLGSAVLAPQILARAGRQGDLALLADGSLQIAVADQEVDAGLACDDIGCRATPLAGAQASGWTLSGRKTAVHGGPTADRFIVSARTSVDGAFGLYDIARDAPGLSVRTYAAIDGSSIADLQLDGVPCGPDARLLAGDGALAALEECRDHALVALGSEAVGICEAVIEVTRDYLAVRRQFGQPLSAFQALQHRVAEMVVAKQKLRGQVLAALAGIGGAAEARGRLASAVKVQIGCAGMFVARQGIQLHGGIGMTDEYIVGHYFKRMTVIDLLLGSGAEHLERFMASTAPIGINGD